MASRTFEETYVASGKVKFVYHDYPLDIHPNAIPAAEAARCAGDQGAFWQMHDLLFEKQPDWTQEVNPIARFLNYAQQLSLNEAQFGACLQSQTHRQAILQARQAGDALQLTGTPSFTVNGKLVDTTGVQTVNEIVERLDAQIDAALAGK